MTSDRRARDERRRRVRAAAVAQAGMASRSQILAWGITRAQLRAELAAGRWSVAGASTIQVGSPRASDRADWWLALLETAPRSVARGRVTAALGGLTALLAAGLEGVDGDGLVHVVAPKSSRPLPLPPGARVHETRRWTTPEDILLTGIPRSRPDVATVQAALWARSDREAALLVVAPIQQRLTTAAAVSEALDRVRRDRRKPLLQSVLLDVAGGVQSLNELDFAHLCRRRRLPEPDRQVVVTSGAGRAYLDVRWRRYRVVVEIDGIGHLRADRWIEDSARHNEIALGGDVVLRIPSLGLRLEPDRHLDLVARALRASGWRAPA